METQRKGFSPCENTTEVRCYLKIVQSFPTADGSVLFEVLSPNVNILHQTLPSVGPPLLHRVLGTQCKDCHVLQRQAEAAQASVELLCKTLSHLVALVLNI